MKANPRGQAKAGVHAPIPAEPTMHALDLLVASFAIVSAVVLSFLR